ncbi:MAG: Deoxyuridine 5'-triphosphate nucleotidohydrolase, partial [uncultured Rubrobacteraceae bacterium]
AGARGGCRVRPARGRGGGASARQSRGRADRDLGRDPGRLRGAGVAAERACGKARHLPGQRARAHRLGVPGRAPGPPHKPRPEGDLRGRAGDEDRPTRPRPGRRRRLCAGRATGGRNRRQGGGGLRFVRGL